MQESQDPLASAEREPVLDSSGLLATKLRAPERRDLIHRPRLVDRLAGVSEHALTVVSAPAGWGKTSLLSDWHRSGDRLTARGRVCWLSLDPQDDDPHRFWTYVVGSLRTVVPGLGERALRTLSSPSRALIEAVLPSLVNELAGEEASIVLVVDDYHVITNPEVHDSVDYLLRRGAPNLHLLIASRTDPPLSIGRLRATGELLEIRARDLAFTEVEATQLLNHRLELGLEAGALQRLGERTEGWAAGLYLAGLSLRGRDDRSGFVDAFTGTNRYVLDYLGAEVLAAHAERERQFLTRTSVLARMSPDLCDAVTGRTDSAALLAQIERTNGFVVALDDHHGWYRSHRLFRELLRHELAVVEPEILPELHTRAAHWFRSVGAVPEAVEHALAADDVDLAEELVLAHWMAYFFTAGRLRTVERWLGALPSERVVASPGLCLAWSWLLLDSGRLDSAEVWVSNAEKAAKDLPDDREAALVRAVQRFKTGDVAAAHAAARRVLELGAPGSGFVDTIVRCVLGYCLYWRGDTGAAIRSLTEAVQLARRSGNQLGEVYTLGYLAAAHLYGGSLAEARRLAGVAVERALEPAVSEHFASTLAHAAHAGSLAASGRLEEAAPAAARALELALRGAGRLELALVLTVQAEILIATGQDATEPLESARKIMRTCRDPGWLPERLARLSRSARRAPSGAAAPPGGAGPRLSEREAALLPLLAGTLSLREIGAVQHVSLNTVKTQSRTLYRKLGVSSRADAVDRARQLGLL